MKRLVLILIVMVSVGSTLWAQDNIVLHTGEEIKAKVEEVGLTEIKYHRTDNPTGPQYTIAKADVLLITYQNGTKDIFGTTKQPETNVATATPFQRGKVIRDYAWLNHAAHKRIIGGAVLIGTGSTVLVTGIGFIAAGAAPQNNYSGNQPRDGGNVMAGVIGVFFTVAGLAMDIVGAVTLSKGLKYRRQARLAKPTIGFNPIIDPNLSRYTRAMNHNRIGSLSITF